MLPTRAEVARLREDRDAEKAARESEVQAEIGKLNASHAAELEMLDDVPALDATRCNGCGLCDSQCHFHAIDTVFRSGKSLARIDMHNCFGCGLCRNVCDAGAITMVMRTGLK